ncbi:alpha-2,8-sialyltransferase 8B-like isoform X3 [Hemibagrus wyckioides]|uniref:alpha-2,8-sialyltransferase 8B-like isoform X3 n=1 Tax=Hemibagrus wyckioides TaxID=337641 RepID=UPI00266C20D5|nr:alpha-2,8-sialyltransferase 8B-like isoform X3 [Hemibagrus wyckioides]
MKTSTIRLLSIFFFASFSSMLFWLCFTQRVLPEVKPNPASNDVSLRVSPNPTSSNNLAAIEPQEVIKYTTRKYSMVHRNSTPVAITRKSTIKVQESDAAVSNPASVSQIPAKSNDTAASNPDKVQQNPAKSNDVAASEPDKVEQHPAKSNDVAASEPDKVKQNPAKSNDVAASEPDKVKQNPAKSTEAAASNPDKVQQNPAKSNDAAASDPDKVKQNPAKSNDVAASEPDKVKQNPAKSTEAAASNPDKVQQNPAKSNDAAASDPDKVKQNPAKSNDVAASEPDKVKQNPAKSNDAAASNPDKVQQNPAKSKEIATIEKLISKYTNNWTKQEENFKSFRSLLTSSCNAISKAVVTQTNSPVGTNITFDADKKIVAVKLDLYNVFPKESPFKNAPWDSCAVVGNGGILANSSCGKLINSASYVIRCNLPPLSNGHEKDTGNKTSLVTANPSIFMQRYKSLNERRKPFVNDMKLYGDALIVVPAFSFWQNMAVSMRALYSLEEINSSGPQAIFFNPSYLKSLADFWRGHGIKAVRLSSGIMMASLALEVCSNVHLYGFWPFELHPYTHQQITNHYYDNKPVNKKMHAMSAEFEALMDLHNKGVIHLHLGECTN